ncbi:MAG: NCS2 family permease [Clostridiales bacterium]|nr:NCS2 family permease [Clostridiales bacterium]
MEKLFKLKAHGTTVRTEIMAGITTFLTMAYILAVNPGMLSGASLGFSTGMNAGAVFTATALAAAIGCLLMAFLSNYPVALASGMGLNAYFAVVCMNLMGEGVENPWKVALTAVLVEGVIFILLSIFKFRETLVNTVPQNLKLGITAGIGLFIAIIGLKGAGIAVASPSTLVDLGDVSSPGFVLAFVGLIAIGVLSHFKVRGAILWGILGTWLLGIVAELGGWYQVDPAAGMYSLIPDFSAGVKSLIPAAPHVLQFDFGYVASNLTNFIVVVFSFLFVDLFDTVGTLIGVASKGNLLDEEGKLPKVGRALMADAIGTVAGACLGTSTVTSYVESTAGVAEGGRTGLTAVTTAALFILALFFGPVFTAIPGFATAPALVYVGLLMMSAVLKMKFEGDMADVLGGFMAIIMMPFTYSIANGIMFGILTWFIIKLITGKIREIHPVMYVVAALFILRLVTLVIPAFS